MAIGAEEVEGARFAWRRGQFQSQRELARYGRDGRVADGEPRVRLGQDHGQSMRGG